MPTCREITELVTDYLEGRLSLKQQLGFRMHVGKCKDCRAYLRQMKTTVRALGRMPAEPMPANVRDELLTRFRSMQPRAGRPAAVPASVGALVAIERALHGWRAWLAGAAILLAAGSILLRSRLEAGPLDESGRCLMMELGGGIVPLVIVGLIASAKRSRVSASVLAVIGMAGGFAAFVMLQLTCPMSHVAPHVLVFHFGGIVYGGLAGIAEARVLSLG
jgi:predicted anti-sigma-YlaC factor YlaD